MRILFLGNNWVGWQVVHWLREKHEEIVGLVIHPPERRKYGAEIVRSAMVSPSSILNAAELGHPETLASIKALQPDIGVSVLFGYILPPPFIDLFPDGVINLHPSYLPYNRGAYPNVWSILEGTPAGVTIHYIDAGVDTGDIISQRCVPVELVDTGASLYRKLEHSCVALFKATWPLIRSKQSPRIPQDIKEGTCHRAIDTACIDEIALDRKYMARELIDLIRARTFPPYRGAYFVHKGQKVYLRMQLSYEKESYNREDDPLD